MICFYPPFWLLYLMPPMFFYTLFGTLLLDTLVITLVLYFNKVKLESLKLVKVILKAWIFGYILNIVFVIIIYNSWSLLMIPLLRPSYKFIQIFLALILILIIAFSINYFNKKLMLRNGINDKTAKYIGLFMGLLTAPWYFLFRI